LFPRAPCPRCQSSSSLTLDLGVLVSAFAIPLVRLPFKALFLLERLRVSTMAHNAATTKAAVHRPRLKNWPSIRSISGVSQAFDGIRHSLRESRPKVTKLPSERHATLALIYFSFFLPTFGTSVCLLSYRVQLRAVPQSSAGNLGGQIDAFHRLGQNRGTGVPMCNF